MLILNATKRAIVASDYKLISWLYDVEGLVSYNWSTITRTYDGTDYTAKIFPESIDTVVELERAKSELGIQAPNEISFVADNAGNTLVASDFLNKTVTLYQVISDGTNEEVIATWKFITTVCDAYYQALHFTCIDFLQHYLEGDYPNERLIKDISTSTDTDLNDNLCVPVPIGECYIPLRSVYTEIEADRAYVLGSTVNAFTLSKVRSPRSWIGKSEWDDSYSFAQSPRTIDGGIWQTFQPIIADSDADGVVDACGLWFDGAHFLDMPTQFSRADTVALVSPSDAIEFVLEDFGVPSSLIDTGVGSSFETAAATFKNWQLVFNGAFFYKRPRREVIALLLNMCHATLVVTDKIELHVLNSDPQPVKFSAHALYPSLTLYPSGDLKPSVADGSTITDLLADEQLTKCDVQRTSPIGKGTLTYQTITQKQSDSGHVVFQIDGEAQDEFLKFIVSAKDGTSVPAGEMLEVSFVQNPGNTVKIGSLYYQRKFLKQANISFLGMDWMLHLRPDDVITVNHADYGGEFDVLIDSMRIKKDGSVQFEVIRFSDDLDNWEDLPYKGVSIVVDDSVAFWSPSVVNPDGYTDARPSSFPWDDLTGTPEDLFRKDADTLDVVSDGTTYAKVLAAGLSSGVVVLASASGNLGDIADGGGYARVASAGISGSKVIGAGLEGTAFGDFNFESGEIGFEDGIHIGASGDEITQHLVHTELWDPGSIAADAMVTNEITVSGAHQSNLCVPGFASITNAGWILSAQVTALDTVTVTLLNKTGAGIDLPSGTLSVGLWQY